MFTFPDPSVYQTAKCFATYGTMSHPDVKQLPSKGKPWSTLLGLDFVHRVDLILPQESLQRLRLKLGQDDYAPAYYRVIMRLGDILDGEFFTQYIKIGNVAMLSECKTGTPNVFTLKDGQLTMFLDKETYERAGLVGHTHGVKGNRGSKPRWIVKFDLRDPASFPGKKGFDRLLYACKTVFNQPLTWLFLNMSQTPDPDPLMKHSPVRYTSSPALTEDMQTQMADITPPQSIMEHDGRADLEAFAANTYEWLSLVRMDSPRVAAKDSIDSYLSRYEVPSLPEERQEVALCRVSWQGFMSPIWVRQTLVDAILSLSSRSWFALSATTFNKGVAGKSTECTIMRPQNSAGRYFLWDIHSHEG